METHDELARVLACPRCEHRSLEQEADGWRCTGCETRFPVLDGVPALYAEPQAILGEWRGRMHHELRRLQHEAETLEAALERDGLRESTRQRLRIRGEAVRAHHDELAALLSPLLSGHAAAGLETYLALRTRLPSDQGLTTYYPNLHRDWCWGEDENRASVELIVEARGDLPPPTRMLVLGAGGGRLALDLHRHFGCALTVALDFNPLLMLVASRLFRGHAVQLHEFPIAPKRIADEAVARTLKPPAPAAPGLITLLADAQRAPFAPGSFDLVVTPWVLDILPDAFERNAARINALLAEGGHWAGFGSLSFAHADPVLRLGFEEVMAAVTEAGFESPQVIEREIPYLCSPSSRHGRRERAVSFHTRRIAPAPAVDDFRALPDWIVTGGEPVPLLPQFQAQVMSTRIHLFIMGMIDGQRSLRDMAAMMEEQRLMTREEAEPAIRSFLIRMYEDAQREGRL